MRNLWMPKCTKSEESVNTTKVEAIKERPNPQITQITQMIR